MITKSNWLRFCESLFPKQRHHTSEEREAYKNFIDSYFDEIQIEETVKKK